MGREILGPQSRKAAPTSIPEVEFALVVNRMIESVKSDPEHLRATVYELARHKLKEQFGAEADIEQLSNALEVAIRGVEAFTINKGQEALPGPGPVPQLAGPMSHVNPDTRFARPRKARWLTAPVRFLVVFAIVLSIVVAAKKEGLSVDALQKRANRLVVLLKGTAPKQALAELPQTTAAVGVPPPEKSPLTPTAYGVYAISNDKLYELELLPGRAPDLRVAISAAILTPSRTTLPDGHLKFIVFKRDTATSAADHAELRVVARIAREMNFDPSGKAVVSKPSDDSWVIRNISIPYRTAPKKDEPDMYEVQRDPGNRLGAWPLRVGAEGPSLRFQRRRLDHRSKTMSGTGGGDQRPILLGMPEAVIDEPLVGRLVASEGRPVLEGDLEGEKNADD